MSSISQARSRYQSGVEPTPEPTDVIWSESDVRMWSTTFDVIALGSVKEGTRVADVRFKSGRYSGSTLSSLANGAPTEPILSNRGYLRDWYRTLSQTATPGLNGEAAMLRLIRFALCETHEAVLEKAAATDEE